MSQNDVKVFVRFRPLNDRERLLPEQNTIWQQANQEELRVKRLPDDPQGKGWTDFRFDQVLPESTTQQEMYEALAQPLVADIMDGYNCSLLAYGMTGSGKTTTMMGFSETGGEGIIPRLMNDIFLHMEEHKDSVLYNITCSAIEIYMEKIQDLLKLSNTNLKIREVIKKNKKNGKTLKSYVYVENCSTYKLSNFQDMKRLIRKADENRTTVATAMNPNSSRSHSVFILNVEQTDLTTQTRKSSKVFLVDLAGSEQVSRSQVDGLELKQATYVNKSLTTLSLVIRSLTTKEAKHVPYRNSKLTRLLTDALGGNSRTALILTCSPSEDNLRETFSTLNFGKRAKQMENSAKINRDLSIKAYRQMVAGLKREVKALKDQLFKEQTQIRMMTGLMLEHGVSLPSGETTEDKEKAQGSVRRSESMPLHKDFAKKRRNSIPFKIEEIDIETEAVSSYYDEDDDNMSVYSSASNVQYCVVDDGELDAEVEIVENKSNFMEPEVEEALEEALNNRVEKTEKLEEEEESLQIGPINTFPDDLDDLCLTSMQDVLIWSTDDLFYFKDLTAKRKKARRPAKKVDLTSPFTVPRKLSS